MSNLLEVLVVESEKGMADRVRAMLSGIAHTTWVRSLKEVREIDRCFRFDCLVVDPDLYDSQNGETLLGVRECFSKPPMVVLNGNFSRESARMALKCGADCYITKESLDPASLQHTIEFLSIKNETGNKETRASISSMHRIAGRIEAL